MPGTIRFIVAEHHNEQNPGATGLSVELKQTKRLMIDCLL